MIQQKHLKKFFNLYNLQLLTIMALLHMVSTCSWRLFGGHFIGVSQKTYLSNNNND